DDIDVGPEFAGMGQAKGIAAPYTFRGPGRGKAGPVLFADGSVRMLPVSINPVVLAALISCASGEVIPMDDVPFEAPRVNVEDRRWLLTIRSVGRKTTAVIEDQSQIRDEMIKFQNKAFRKAGQ